MHTKAVKIIFFQIFIYIQSIYLSFCDSIKINNLATPRH